MYPILENETPMIPSDKRGRFIKSSLSVVSEDIGNRYLISFIVIQIIGR
jgi:hypothetical protein